MDRMLSALERAYVDLAGWNSRRVRSGKSSDPSIPDVEGLSDYVWGLVADASAGGASSDRVAQFVTEATRESAVVVHDGLASHRSQMLRYNRAMRRGFDRRLKAFWGPALDCLFELYVASEEVGAEIQAREADSADHTTEALLGLHARSCLLLSEVHTLLSKEFPLGAWARARTLHETAVVANVLSEHGRSADTSDLCERFLAHATVQEAKDLRAAEAAGIEVDEVAAASVVGLRRALLARFGAGFADDYGWARPLFPAKGPKDRVTFYDLEVLARTGLGRWEYRQGAHHVHSSAHSVNLSTLLRGDQLIRLTGPTNVDLDQPASAAMAAAAASLGALAAAASPDLPNVMDMIGAQVCGLIAVRASGKFASAQAEVMNREAALQRTKR